MHFSSKDEETTACLTMPLDDSENRVTGSIHLSQGKTYVLENCGESCEAFIELIPEMPDEASFEDDDSDLDDRIPTEKELELMAEALEDQETEDIIHISVYYTEEFEASTSDIPLVLANMFALINEGFSNSNIPLRAELFCAKKAEGLEEIRDSKSQLFAFELFQSKLALVIGKS